jgi:hypothetical protein
MKRLQSKADKSESKLVKPRTRAQAQRSREADIEREKREVLESVLASVEGELAAQRKQTAELVEQLEHARRGGDRKERKERKRPLESQDENVSVGSLQTALRTHAQALQDCKQNLQVGTLRPASCQCVFSSQLHGAALTCKSEVEAHSVTKNALRLANEAREQAAKDLALKVWFAGRHALSDIFTDAVVCGWSCRSRSRARSCARSRSICWKSEREASEPSKRYEFRCCFASGALQGCCSVLAVQIDALKQQLANERTAHTQEVPL